jgi:hypothetical protein
MVFQADKRLGESQGKKLLILPGRSEMIDDGRDLLVKIVD